MGENEKKLSFEAQRMAYVAAILDRVSFCCGVPLSETVSWIGSDGIGRLIHNAPMNWHLPPRQILREVIRGYHLPQGVFPEEIVLDADSWQNAARCAEAMASGEAELGQRLYEVLLRTRGGMFCLD